MNKENFLARFNYSHLRIDIQDAVKPFKELALEIDARLSDTAYKLNALKKLLESRDNVIRALL